MAGGSVATGGSVRVGIGSGIDAVGIVVGFGAVSPFIVGVEIGASVE